MNKSNTSLKQKEQTLLKEKAELERWLQDHDAKSEGHAEVKEKRLQAMSQLEQIEKELEQLD